MKLCDLPLDIGVNICQFLEFQVFIHFLQCSLKTREWCLQIDALSDFNAIYFGCLLSLFKHKKFSSKSKHVLSFTQLRRFTFDYWSFVKKYGGSAHQFELLGQFCFDSLRNKTFSTVSLSCPTEELLTLFRQKSFVSFSLLCPSRSISLEEFQITELQISVKHLIVPLRFHSHLQKLTLTEIGNPWQLTWLTLCPNLSSLKLEFDLLSFRQPESRLIWYNPNWIPYLQTYLKLQSVTHLDLEVNRNHKFQCEQDKFLMEKLWLLIQEATCVLEHLTFINPPRPTLECITDSKQVCQRIHSLSIEILSFPESEGEHPILISKLCEMKQVQIFRFLSQWGRKSDLALQNWILHPSMVGFFTRQLSTLPHLREIQLEGGPELVSSSTKFQRLIQISKQVCPHTKWTIC